MCFREEKEREKSIGEREKFINRRGKKRGEEEVHEERKKRERFHFAIRGFAVGF